MKKLLLSAAAAVALLCIGTPLQADVVLGTQNWTTAGADQLTLTPVVPGGNQPQNIQCIICGANQPQQSPLFGYTDFSNAGNLSTLAFFSTNVTGGGNPGFDTLGIPYDGSFLRNFIIANGGGTLDFSIGVDVNDTNNPQTLESFFLLNVTQHTVLASFIGPALVPSLNNGTGFPDYTLTGFNIDIGSDIAAGDQLAFFARISNANDGPDSFFLIPSPVAVPGPIAGAGLPGLIALGSFGLAWLSNRRRKRNILSV